MNQRDPMFPQGVIIEFIPRGDFVKVTAVDPRTGIEATIVGDPARPRASLEEVAINKLRYVIEKRRKN